MRICFVWWRLVAVAGCVALVFGAAGGYDTLAITGLLVGLAGIAMLATALIMATLQLVRAHQHGWTGSE